MWGWWKRDKGAASPQFDLAIWPDAGMARRWTTFVLTGIALLPVLFLKQIPGGLFIFVAGQFLSIILKAFEIRPKLRLKKTEIEIEQDGKVDTFSYSNLRLSSNIERAEETYVLAGPSGKSALKIFGPFYGLMPEAVRLIAELQKRRVHINAPGFGWSNRFKQHPNSEKLASWLGAIYVASWLFFIVGIVGFLVSPFEWSAASILVPSVALMMLSSSYAFVKQYLAMVGESKTFPCWIELRDSDAQFHRLFRPPLAFKWGEVKTVIVSVETKRLFSRISVAVDTHYSRRYHLLKRGFYLPFGHSIFIEKAMKLGLHIVYEAKKKFSDQPEVIYEIEPKSASKSLLFTNSAGDEISKPTGKVKQGRRKRN